MSEDHRGPSSVVLASRLVRVHRCRWSSALGHPPNRRGSCAPHVSKVTRNSSSVMRHPFLCIVAAVATCALAGCEKQVTKTPKPTVRPSSARVVMGWIADSARNQAIAAAINAPSTGAVAEPSEILDLKEDSASDPLALVTTKIDTTIKLGLWLKSHPADRVGMVAPVGDNIDDRFCRRAVVNTRLGGHTFVRSALFYIPFPPKGEKLPTDTAKIAEDDCDLRTIVLASEETDWAAGHALRDSLALVIDKRLGPHTEGVPLAAGGIRGTTEGKMWRREGTSVVVATAPVYKPKSVAAEGEAVDTATSTNAKALAVAYAPGSDAGDFDSWSSRYDELHGLNPEDRQALYRNVDSAVTWAAMPAVATDLKTVIAYLRTRDENKPQELRPPQMDVGLLRALKAIHEAAPSLSVPRRAAALLAGDVALAATFSTPSADSDGAILRALPSLGISIERDPEGYGYRNPRAWLWEAYRLDSTGRAGRAAFVELLGLRWPSDNSCSGDEYKRVIEHGEAALARGDDNPLIHFYVGSAYKSIYDLAHYESPEVGNPEAFKSQAEPARLKAIEHFRAALESLPDRATRREAWMKAMRLLLRRSGEQPEYVCFQD